MNRNIIKFAISFILIVIISFLYVSTNDKITTHYSEDKVIFEIAHKGKNCSAYPIVSYHPIILFFLKSENLKTSLISKGLSKAMTDRLEKVYLKTFAPFYELAIMSEAGKQSKIDNLALLNSVISELNNFIKSKSEAGSSPNCTAEIFSFTRNVRDYE
jgi:hypothetical protein